MTLDPAAVERFRGDLERALGRPVAPGERIALAVSGGPDSMAMLALAHAAFGDAVIAATVDHKLRPEAAREASMVAGYCAAIGVPHATLAPEQPIAGASVQAQARTIRYALLQQWARVTGASMLGTAHHADDQAETFLMRAARGSGLAGLAAIRERREFGAVMVVRPLLGWRRAGLRTIATAAGAPFIDDPSNTDPQYDRARFRELFEAHPWLDVKGIARAAEHLAEAERAILACADMAWEDRAVIEEGGVRLDARDLPREVRRRLVRSAIATVRARTGITEPEWHDGANVESLLDALIAESSATQAGVMASARNGTWRFSPAPPRRSH